MKVGDLFKYSQGWEVSTGIIVGFDGDNDPIVRDNRSGVVAVSYTHLTLPTTPYV